MEVSSVTHEFVLRALRTIAAPDFCEFVIELTTIRTAFSPSSSWDHWRKIDKFLEERMEISGSSSKL